MKVSEVPTYEPLITVATITAGVSALIGLFVAFGAPLTGDQQTAIMAVVAVAAPVIVGVIARRSVTPNAAVAERVDKETGMVIAGEANNQIPEGVPVRKADAPLEK